MLHGKIEKDRKRIGKRTSKDSSKNDHILFLSVTFPFAIPSFRGFQLRASTASNRKMNLGVINASRISSGDFLYSELNSSSLPLPIGNDICACIDRDRIEFRSEAIENVIRISAGYP